SSRSALEAAVSYGSAAVPVREDLEDAHLRYLACLRGPGTWLSGVQRTAIAAETRASPSCRLCTDRKRAVSPYAFTGTHDAVSDLAAPVVDAVHRIASGPGRLTHQWYTGVLAGGLGEGPFVELVGVVAAIVAIDSFAAAVGATPLTLERA